MRKLATLIGVLLVIHIALLFVRPRNADTAPAKDSVRIGVVFDIGGRGDKSFNDGASVTSSPVNPPTVNPACGCSRRRRWIW